MKVLLDENIPVQLKQSLPKSHEWYTVRELTWQSTKNGKLLEQMRIERFKGLITMDKNLYNQQNLKHFHLILIILKAKDNKIATLQKAVPAILEILSDEVEGIFEIAVDWLN